MVAKSSSAALRAWSQLFLVAALMVGFGIIGFLTAGGVKRLLEPTEASFTASLDKKRLEDIKRQLQKTIEQQEALASREQLPPPLSVLEARLEKVEEQQQRLDRIIVDDPDKALELPLMRRDLEALEQKQAVAIDSVRRSVEQVYDLSKWLIGALALGIISLAANTFLRRKEQ